MISSRRWSLARIVREFRPGRLLRLKVKPASTSETHMFLVEIEAGREALYDSVGALGEAIRRGEVGPQSRIFHRASRNWLSITLHPEFRKAVAARESEALPPLARTRWTFFGMEPKGREIDEAPAKPEAKQQARKTGESRSGLRGLIERTFRRRSVAPSTQTSSS